MTGRLTANSTIKASGPVAQGANTWKLITLSNSANLIGCSNSSIRISKMRQGTIHGHSPRFPPPFILTSVRSCSTSLMKHSWSILLWRKLQVAWQHSKSDWHLGLVLCLKALFFRTLGINMPHHARQSLKNTSNLRTKGQLSELEPSISLVLALISIHECPSQREASSNYLAIRSKCSHCQLPMWVVFFFFTNEQINPSSNSIINTLILGLCTDCPTRGVCSIDTRERLCFGCFWKASQSCFPWVFGPNCARPSGDECTRLAVCLCFHTKLINDNIYRSFLRLLVLHQIMVHSNHLSRCLPLMPMMTHCSFTLGFSLSPTSTD